MKTKIVALLLTLTLTLSVAACGTSSTPDTNTATNTPTEQVDATNETNAPENVNTPEPDSPTEQLEDSVEPGTLDALEADVVKDVEDYLAALTGEMDNLVAEIDSFDKYSENADKVEAFYTKVCTDSSLIGICLMEHAVTYAEFIIGSDEDFDDKYDDLDELYDVIYEDAGDEVFDGIYDGILEDMFDIFYDELLDDAYDSVPYDDWYDARSNEYDWWSDARSDSYDIWSDTRSDIYDFWSNLRSAIYDKDIGDATKVVNDFKEDIEDLKAEVQE